ncbi:hypothetical protein PsYK624_140040 [Phanerochaete sordida]|uniref:Uncharacterized protein n=1 Tax=Phanerochaete sordida TaxID=48140 RepID=A0A9P3LJU9_9APHY|nr:hypothetical protein PsYK624_140040 [Phanerochaete sordida]
MAMYTRVSGINEFCVRLLPSTAPWGQSRSAASSHSTVAQARLSPHTRQQPTQHTKRAQGYKTSALTLAKSLGREKENADQSLQPD